MNLEEYQLINNSFKNNLVFHLGNTSGFFSEFNNMVLAMIYCFQNNIRFELFSEDCNFVLKRGWTDYFKTFCKEVNSQVNLKFNRRRSYPVKLENNIILKNLYSTTFKSFCSLLKKLNRIKYFTYDVFDLARNLNVHEINIENPKFHFNGDLREISRIFINMIWRFNENTISEIAKMKAKINLPDEYISIHIRGGDKFVESPFLGIEPYMKIADQYSSQRNIFISTDDYRIFNSLVELYPKWNFFTLTDQYDNGYFFSKNSKVNLEENKKEAIKLLASIEIMTNSQLFIGTYSSNIGMFMGMKMPKEKVIGIDLPDWQIW